METHRTVKYCSAININLARARVVEELEMFPRRSHNVFYERI